MGKGRDEGSEIHCTDIEALKDNATNAVEEVAARWLSMPKFTEECEVFDQRQLRDAMGLRATIEAGDPWPAAEKQLLEEGFRWHLLGGTRVMFLKEREDYVPDDGWEEAEELEE